MRLNYTKNGLGTEIIEENNFYPFGMKHEGYNALAGNPAYNYQYNGKELQKETGWSDFGARMYMSDIARWGVIDPLAETSRRFTPYNYALNNPVMFIDPDGRKAMAPDTWEWNVSMSGAWGYALGGGAATFGSFAEFLGEENPLAKFNKSNSSGGGGGGRINNEDPTPKPNIWKSIGKFFSNLFRGKKKENTIVAGTAGIVQPGPVIFEGYATEAAATETAGTFVSGVSLTAALTLGAILTPTMIKEPAMPIAMPIDIDIPDTNGEKIAHFYRAMSNAEFSSTLGYLQDRNNSGEGPHVRADLDYLLSASFINKPTSPYDIIVEYTMLESRAKSFYLTPFHYVPGTGPGGTIFNAARATGVNYLKYEKGVSVGFPGNSTILFNSALIVPPSVYMKLK